MYHRVNYLAPDPWNLAVTPENFAEQLEVLEATTEVQPLSNISQRHGNQYCSFITFDDGYADNFELARPVLEAKGLPATIFVSSGFIGSPGELWSDTLDRIFLQSLQLPRMLDLHVDGRDFQFDFTGFESGEAQVWDWDDDDLTIRHTAYRTLFRALRPLPLSQQADAIATLESWAESHRSRPERLFMSPEQLQFLSRSKLIEIGAHTVTHPVLSLLSIDNQWREIMGSRHALEAMCGASIKSFAYPNGGHDDYTEETVNLVREAGFHYACAAFPGLATSETDLHQIPRLMVRNWDGDTFARILQQTLQPV